MAVALTKYSNKKKYTTQQHPYISTLNYFKNPCEQIKLSINSRSNLSNEKLFFCLHFPLISTSVIKKKKQQLSQTNPPVLTERVHTVFQIQIQLHSFLAAIEEAKSFES